MMATRLLTLCGAFFVLTLFSSAFVQSSFPSIDEFEVEFYTTEVQVTDVQKAFSSYATEYYDNLDDKGSLKMYFQGDLRSIYYDNSTYEITEVNDSNCTAWDEDISDFDYFPIYFGWLNRDPLVIGPSAPLWYAQTRIKDVVEKPSEVVRDINCDKFELNILTTRENLTIVYYFAPTNWTTPYQFKKLRIPIRIRVTGESSRYSANPNLFVPVDQISDFAYFKPTISDMNDLLPPLGIGCRFKKETKDLPKIPEVFQYSAEVVNLIQTSKGKNTNLQVEIQFQITWYDHSKLLARLDRYSRGKGFKSALYDFNTGTAYKLQTNGSCQMTILRDAEFEIYDYGMTRRMMEPKEAMYLDGSFYEMGKREIRGLTCDAYESVAFDEYFRGEKYHKLVVTVYFTDSDTVVGVEGIMESRIPVYYLITAWESDTKPSLQVQYNIFGYKVAIWPEMYSSFNLERCYTKAESKAYFVVIMEVPAKIAAFMEDQDELTIKELRYVIAKHARVPEMRIPYLKADYKSTGVYVTGLILERPPALLQFYSLDTGPTITFDPDLKVAIEAKNLEQCSYACVDEKDFTCKGFYICNKACFLKSTDPFDNEDPGNSRDLGECTEYLRAEIESSNFRQSYLDDALGNLETAVLNGSASIAYMINKSEIVVKLKDIVIGDGPYTGVDAGDKPYSLSIETRKLDASLESVVTADYTETLHECYKRCKEAGSSCSSFSFCPGATDDKKQCMYTQDLIVKGVTKDTELKPDGNCNIYNLKFLDYFTAYPERISLLPGDKVIRSIESLEKCAESCRKEKDFKCRGFEYCRSRKTCTLHKTHILDLKPGESVSTNSQECIHYAAHYIADYMDLDGTLIDDKSDVRYETTLEECAKICSENLKESCKSFNYCPSADFSQSTCALSSKLLRDDGVTTTEIDKCSHYEKRDIVHDWDNSKASTLASSGYTKKTFVGVVIGTMVLGLIIGALVFVLYSFMKSRSSGGGDGMAVRFMKNES